MWTITAAKGISMDAVIVAVISKLNDIFTLKDCHKNGTEVFSQWTMLFCDTLDQLWQELQYCIHCLAWQLVTGRSVTLTNLQEQLCATRSRCFFLPTGKDTAVNSVSKFRMGINKFKVYRLWQEMKVHIRGRANKLTAYFCILVVCCKKWIASLKLYYIVHEHQKNCEKVGGQFALQPATSCSLHPFVQTYVYYVIIYCMNVCISKMPLPHLLLIWFYILAGT